MGLSASVMDRKQRVQDLLSELNRLMVQRLLLSMCSRHQEEVHIGWPYMCREDF